MIFSFPSWLYVGAACLIAGFIGGCEHKQRELDAYKAAGEAQERQTAQTIQKHKQIATEVKNDYESRIAAIRAAYRVRPSGTGLVPTSPTTSGYPDARSTDSLPLECAETTQQLVSLQDFIKETR